MGRNSDVRVNFIGDADSLARAAAKARHEMDSVSRRGHTASTALGTAVGTLAGRGIAGLASAAAGGVRSLGALANASIDAASATVESVSKSRQVFGAYSKDVEAWAADNTKNILLSRQAAVEGVATFGNLFIALGVGDKAAAGMSTTLVGLASDLASFDDANTDEALLALRSGLLGEAEPLRRFGVSLSEARVEAEAYALGLAKPVKNAAAIVAANNAVAAATVKVSAVEKAHGKGTLAAAQARDGLARAEAGLTKAMHGQKAVLSDAVKVQARQSIILKDTVKAQGDAARTLDGEANSTRQLEKRMADLSATLGQKLLPYKIKAVKAAAQLFDEFERGVGTGGQIRDALGQIGGVAREVGGVLNTTVVPAVKFFADHPDALKALAASMVVYAAATKSAAIWSLRIKPAPAPGGVAGGGIGTVGLLAGAVVVGADGARKGISNNQGLIDKVRDPTGLDGLRQRAAAAAAAALPLTPHAVQTPDDYGQKARGGARSVAPAQVKSTAAQQAVAIKNAASTVAGATDYATDQFAATQARQNAAVEKAAEAKRKAAEALEKATQKIRDALQARKDMSAGIKDSLIGSNSVLQSGISWTAKDLLAAFAKKMAQVKRFAALISTMTHKGFAPSIISQVAAAGVDGGMATAQGLASASAAQVKQFNGVQGGIDRAAGLAGDRATLGVLGKAPKPTPQIIQLVVDGRVLAQAVNDWNGRASGRGRAS